jgi:hypothetical protein
MVVMPRDGRGAGLLVNVARSHEHLLQCIAMGIAYLELGLADSSQRNIQCIGRTFDASDVIASAFASELLMPDELLATIAAERAKGSGCRSTDNMTPERLVARVAARCGVSNASMLVRLRSIGATPTGAEWVAKEATPAAQRAEAARARRMQSYPLDLGLIPKENEGLPAYLVGVARLRALQDAVLRVHLLGCATWPLVSVAEVFDAVAVWHAAQSA